MKKPKIAHIITRLIIGGAQENTFYTVEGLMKKGYDVTLITGPAVGPEGTLFVEAEKASVKIILIPSMKRAVNPFLDTIAFFKLLNIFKREKYDIVHTHSSKAGILARIAAKLAGVRLVIHTIHGLPYHK
ncbi:MAG: glycosyltransferase, partial [Candidatus Aureabacteria bacterium]|nr:glycosyltransferase [Candidatus Auribacterota bacterium]